jgi:hypothetical protein
LMRSDSYCRGPEPASLAVVRGIRLLAGCPPPPPKAHSCDGRHAAPAPTPVGFSPRTR